MQIRFPIFLVFFTLITYLSPVSSLYFEIVEGQKRCFIEEVAEDVLVLGTYTNLEYNKIEASQKQYDGGQSTIIQVKVNDPSGAQILVHDTISNGRFAFTSHMGGEHTICIQTTTTQYYGQQRTFKFQLTLDIGESATDYTEIAKQEHLSAIEVEVRKLNDKIRVIRGEQQYQQKREEAFRDTSESTCSRVMWWSILQCIVLLASGLYQVTNLKGFFKSKKLA